MASIALATWPGVWMRPFLSGTTIRLSSCASDADTSGLRVRTSGRGSPLIALAMSWITVSPLFGRSPVSISKNTTPSE